MKTVNSSKRNEQIFVMKQIFFALQIIIISLAIPLLAYLQLTYKSDGAQSDPRSALQVTTPRQNSTASTENTAVVAHAFLA